MIDSALVEQKDFSIVFGQTVDKLSAVRDGILYEACENGQPTEEVLNGWHLIIGDIIDDLSKINKALYSS